VLEESSTHPIAKAIVTYCTDKPSDGAVVPDEIKEIPGKGMTGTFTFKSGSTAKKYEVALGNESLIAFLNGSGHPQDVEGMPGGTVSPPTATSPSFSYLSPLIVKHQALGHSTAIFGIRKIAANREEDLSSSSYSAVAVFAIADPIRAEAPEVLQSLRDAGLEVHMCTGDNQTTALAIASQLHIPASNVRAGVLPQDKAGYIRELQASLQGSGAENKRKIVAFVGDGTNDTPALAAADVSIALSSGSDVAITTASFILLNSDLKTILALVRLAKRVFLRVKLNFAWAAVYNLCLVPVAAGVFFPIGANSHSSGWRLSPVWASVAMAASSVSVVASSLALRLPEAKLGLFRIKK
jgi:P-type Cu+ transporter